MCFLQNLLLFIIVIVAWPLQRIKGWVEGIEIAAVQMILDITQGFTEPLEVNDFPLTQEADDVAYIRVIRQTENVVVGKAGLLFWCDLVRTTFFVGGIGFL